MIEAMSSGELAWNLNTVNGTVANSKVWSQGNVPRFDTEATEATVRVAFIQPSGTTYCYTDGKGNVVQPELDENYFWSGGTYFVKDTIVEAITRDLFYQNRGTVQGADPSVITIGDTFYLYATNATDAADYLVNHGVPFRDAHGIIGRLVLYCIEQNKAIDELSLEELQAISPVFEQDIFDAVSLETCVNKRMTIGAPGPDAMKEVIRINKEYLSLS